MSIFKTTSQAYQGEMATNTNRIGTVIKSQKQEVKEMYAQAKIEEHHTKMIMYQLWIASMIESKSREILNNISQCDLYKHNIKRCCGNIKTLLPKLNIQLLTIERSDFMPVVAHGAPGWRLKYDGVGNLTMRIQANINKHLQHDKLIWQSCTHNTIANCSNRHQEIMIQLYELNGYCAIAKSIYQAFKQYADELLQVRTYIQYDTALFDIIKGISHNASTIIDQSKCVDNEAVAQSQWWKQACDALEHISLKLVGDDISDIINDSIFESIKDYTTWYIANTILNYKYNDIVSDLVKRDARTYLVGKGEMMRFCREIKYLADKCEMQDVWDIMDEMEIHMEKCPMVTKFNYCAIHWAELECDKIAERKKAIEEFIK